MIRPAEKTLWNRCESLEYRVFLDSDYVGKNPAERIVDFDGYDDTEFLAAFGNDQQRLPVGACVPSGIVRLVHAPWTGRMGIKLFPTIDHAEELEIFPECLRRILAMDPRRCIDIAAMAVSRDKRNSKMSKALIKAIMIRSWEIPRIRYAFAAIDTPFYCKLKKRGLPFQDLGPSAMYMGSMTTAAMIEADQMPRSLEKLMILPFKFRGHLRRFIDRGINS